LAEPLGASTGGSHGGGGPERKNPKGVTKRGVFWRDSESDGSGPHKKRAKNGPTDFKKHYGSELKMGWGAGEYQKRGGGNPSRKNAPVDTR